MPRGIGRAMEKALAREDGKAPPGSRESLLMHPQRRELFRLLCLRPCATAGELARLAGLSSNAARWHLERMKAAALVVRDAASTYYPKGFIDPDDGALFRVLAEGGTRDVYRAVLDGPGSTQREVAEDLGISRQSVFKCATLLERHKLVTSIEDGRFRRYYPTGLLFQRREAHRPRARAFADALVKQLQSGGLTPHVLRQTDRQLLVRVARGKAAETIDLTLDPYTTVLQ
ncbi:MAG TPA: helix-turn-helix domain-containing protein [Thermoplasmata archaeon]|nr:helix-turn-helix domain-containing protein [Thermoplasmata archaeon]